MPYICKLFKLIFTMSSVCMFNLSSPFIFQQDFGKSCTKLITQEYNKYLQTTLLKEQNHNSRDQFSVYTVLTNWQTLRMGNKLEIITQIIRVS